MNEPNYSLYKAVDKMLEQGELRENFAEEQAQSATADELPPTTAQIDNAKAVAELDLNKIPDGSIMGMLRCTINDLNEVRGSEVYKSIYAGFAYEQSKSLMDTEKRWNQIEALATENLYSGLLNDPLNVDLSLKAAMVANRNRKSSMKDALAQQGNNTQTGTTNTTNVLVLQLPPRVASIMGTMREMTPDMPAKVTGMISMQDLNEKLNLGFGVGSISGSSVLENSGSELNFTVDNMSLV